MGEMRGGGEMPSKFHLLIFNEHTSQNETFQDFSN